MGKDTRGRLRGKAKEIGERLTEAKEMAQRNVTEGLDSALSGEPRYFGGPPSGRAPAARPPSRRPHRRTD